MKKYVLDTSVLIHDPKSIYKFEENYVVITSEVLQELDKKKSQKGMAGKNARDVVRELLELINNNKVKQERINDSYFECPYVKLENKGRIYFNINPSMLPTTQLRVRSEQVTDEQVARMKGEVKSLDMSLLHVPSNVDIIDKKKQGSVDLKILSEVIKLDGILVTKDKVLQIIAKSLCIPVEDYTNDNVKSNKEHTGIVELSVAGKDIDLLYKKGYIGAKPSEDNIYPNTYHKLTSYESGNQSVLARIKNGVLKKVEKENVHGVSPKNMEQTFAIDALMDSEVEIVTITGIAGTGKTLLALAAGLEQTVEGEPKYNKVIAARPIVSMGKDLGALPGELEDKMKPWMQPIFDNIEFLYSTNPNEIINQYKEANKLEIIALAYIRGRSIPGQYFIIDEAQNLTPKEVKTIITRAGTGTKVVLVGDTDQIDHHYLDKKSNGLSYVIEKFKGQNNYAHIHLDKSERSKLAQQGADLL